MIAVIEVALKAIMKNRGMAVEEVAGEKRRKVGDGEFRSPTSMLAQITTNTSDEMNNVPVSCCSSNGSTEPEDLQFIDLEEIVESRKILKYRSNTGARKRRTEIMTRSGLPKTITANPSPVISSIRILPTEKLPPATELEEFFASAEKQLHKRFKAKYNYDIVNDTPIEGRFEWIELKPEDAEFQVLY